VIVMLLCDSLTSYVVLAVPSNSVVSSHKIQAFGNINSAVKERRKVTQTMSGMYVSIIYNL